MSLKAPCHNKRCTTVIKGLVVVLLAGFASYGCMTAAEHRAAVRDDSQKLTVGTVQREIRVGMPASEVASVLGAPNIVTTDENRREVWIYDKIATERAFSTSSGGISTLILGGALVGAAGVAGGAVNPYYGSSAGASSTNQRTLTVIIKYDEQMKVRDFAYHASSF